ncbi:hypothetical protein Salat_2012600 [Sesamum alatum]|uniref:Secreted protein n=1 Tax=Sesamum alatum TaxID=300844 RepID=A0AAE2CFT1_9LAMI|nr:hypothetical protein Salat_2012600 [Sesamum alatum]
MIPVLLVAACLISARNRAEAAAEQPQTATSDAGIVIDGGQVAEAVVEIQGCCCGGGGGGGDGGGCGGCGIKYISARSSPQWQQQHIAAQPPSDGNAVVQPRCRRLVLNLGYASFLFEQQSPVAGH